MKNAVDANAYMDLHGLAALKGKVSASGGHSIDEVRQVAGHFESMFVQMLLKNMRATSFDEDGLFNSDQTKFYQQMFDQQIAVEVSRGKGLGIADMLVRQLGGDPRAGPAAEREVLFGRAVGGPAAQAQPPSAEPADPAAAVRAPQVDARWQPASPREFLTDVWPHARTAARELGVPEEAVMAQAALETGWGRHVMQHPDGRSSFNLFGIKAGSHWEGDRVSQSTLEFRDGVMQRERASFRAYDSLAAGFEDYVRVLRQPRYREALGAGDSAGFAAGLERGGYATDPDYASKIKAIINRPAFREQLAELKRATGAPLVSVQDPIGVEPGAALSATRSTDRREG